MDGRRLNVLAVAAAVHPDRGSEPGMGWGWIRALAKRHDVWAIAGLRGNNRACVERELRKEPDLEEHLRLSWVPFDKPSPLTGRIPLLYYRHYHRWHENAFAAARNLAETVPFDVAHQVNMIGYREPGLLHQLDLPFVWGPIGGGGSMPLRFWPTLGVRGTLYYLAYNAANRWQMLTNRRVRTAAARADAIVAATSDMRHGIRSCWGRESEVVTETFPDENAFQHRRIHTRRDGPLRIVWSGLHVPRKALPLLLHGLARVPGTRPVEVDILGDGPMREAWQKLAGHLGIDRRCRWHGWMDRSRALDIMQRADVMAITSLRDATSSVLLEALSLGQPVICLDHCGFSDVVDESSGIKIPVTSPRKVAAEIGEAIRRLGREPGLLERLSAGAIRRGKELAWPARVEAMTRQYYQAIIRYQRKLARRSAA